jgi:hypothetical protein
MEIFTKDSWEKYKQSVLEFNHNATKDMPFGTICGYLKKPNFVEYMDFVFQEVEE